MRRTVRAAMAVLAVALLVGVLPSPAAAMDEQAAVVQIAYAHIGDKFRLGASGPNRFDCSGFVWYVFNTAGLADRIGGKPLRARGYQKLFRARGLLSKDPKTARVGDLVFYGNPAKHTGIVTRIDAKGRPHVTSALTTGVHETRYNSLSVRFDSFAHVGLNSGPSPTPTPSPSPSPSPTPSLNPTAPPIPTDAPSAPVETSPGP